MASHRATAPRNTCFAILSAIELDLRAFLVHDSEILGPSSQILPDDIREKALARRKSRDDSDDDPNPTDTELLDYTHIQELSVLLNEHTKRVAPSLRAPIKTICTQLNLLTPVRNRVCHSRPLEPDDLVYCINARDTLLAIKEVVFPELTDLTQKLTQTPDYCFGIEIPPYHIPNNEILHNLPIPEFDETGFLGRTNDRKELHKHLRSSYPVVTILGEGGVGKTALAQRCLYDLLDDQSPAYDAIVWTSLKISALTPFGIQTIRNDIADTLKLLGTVAEIMGTSSAFERNVDDLLTQICHYMTENRVIVVIDNLEAIETTLLRKFLQQIPPQSKLLVTSRVPIGEFETRYKLEELDSGSSLDLLRRYARYLNVEAIYKSKQNVLTEYTKKLFHNPLLLKWFVSGVARGLDPQSIVSQELDDFPTALKFCFENVFDNLDQTEQDLIETLASAKRPLTITEIKYLSGADNQSVAEAALSTLRSSSIVKMTSSRTGSYCYQLSKSAASYVSMNRPPDTIRYNTIRTRFSDLDRMIQKRGIEIASRRYDVFSVHVDRDNRDEVIVALKLNQALKFVRMKDFDNARLRVEMARQLHMTLSEVYRISSLVEAEAGEVYRAEQELDRAVECAPRAVIVRYTYASFLMKYYENFDGALSHLDVALEIDPHSYEIRFHRATILTRIGQYSEASSVLEELLEGKDQLSKHHRIALYSQASDCYRRWSEQNRRDKEDVLFREHIDRSLTLLCEASVVDDYDRITLQKLGKSLQDGIVGSAHFQDFGAVELYIAKIEGHQFVVPRSKVSFKQADKVIQSLEPRVDLLQRLQKLFPSIECPGFAQRVGGVSGVVSVDSSGSWEGVIVHLDRDMGFGFIERKSKPDLYFHRKSLSDRGMFAGLCVGDVVRYQIGKNKKGECANRVSVV